MPTNTSQGILDRLQVRPFEESIVLLFSGLAIVFIVPFGLIRMAEGSWAHGTLDLTIAGIALAIGCFVWRTGRTEHAAPVLVAVFALTLVAITWLFGTNMLFWAYPVTTATFFLLRPASALRVNAATFLAIAPQALSLGAWPEIAGFIAPLAANNVLALIFAAGMRHSRANLRLMAERDALTGIGNRHAFEPALMNALRKRLEVGTPIALLAIDIDHFKRVNDRHGHEAGDRVLIEVARLIEHSVRAGDSVFRYGGEELVVIADGAGNEAAGRMAEKIRRWIRRTPIRGIGPVAVSIGVSEARPDDTPKAWFQRTDGLLYKAKAGGRNRVCVDTDCA
ncbi:GGDEF domain-containing protein [Halofilum ochraceum]|uniref:GGDEF domain-containing protein n=1 Tax=Halofilum ochraceum TaxID=1611323 RepID=UPI0008DAE3F5|nr:GGDEF domain-containing protein [Halofilum ochraceum]